tara:strand:- start:485 stop:772 length:288 start_codon:yes stop_codon:yes gene_type:complete
MKKLCIDLRHEPTITEHLSAYHPGEHYEIVDIRGGEGTCAIEADDALLDAVRQFLASWRLGCWDHVYDHPDEDEDIDIARWDWERANPHRPRYYD